MVCDQFVVSYGGVLVFRCWLGRGWFHLLEFLDFEHEVIKMFFRNVDVKGVIALDEKA